MSPREKRIEVFEDTMQCIKEDPDLRQSVSSSIQNTKVYYEDDYPQFLRDEKETTIAVTKERTYEAAQRLKKEYPSKKIAVMNFANAFHPGGGVKTGASAQEECMCRCSTLLPCLETKELRNSFYKHHHALSTQKASDSLIYTPNVTVFKTDTAFPEKMKKEDWYDTDVVTIAAPNLNGMDLSDEELYEIHLKRITHLLHVSAFEDVDVLILGAFGCGAFRNDPYIVSEAFHDAIDQFPKVFEHICFAVYCSPRDEENYKAFMKMFS